jgi:hypothetical protein
MDIFSIGVDSRLKSRKSSFAAGIFFVLSCILAHIPRTHANLNSSTGNITFDINNDGTSDARLDSNGFAIGQGLTASANLHVEGNSIVTGKLSVGSTNSNSTLSIAGTSGFSIEMVSDNITLGANSHTVIDTAAGNLTITLPYAGNAIGRLYTIKKISLANELILKGGGGSIDSLPSHTFTSGNAASMTLISDGSQWHILSGSSSGITDAWTPSSISTALWLDANDYSTLTYGVSGNVSQWNDKSGNARHLTQGTESMHPKTGVTTLNGLNALDFDGSNDFMSVANAAWHNNGDIHIFSVARCDGSTDIVVANNDGAGGYFCRAQGTTQYRSSMIADGGSATAGTFTAATPHIFESKYATPVTGARIDGGTEVTFSGSGYTSTVNSLTIGAGDNGTTNSFNGEVAEVLVVAGVMSTGNRQKVEGYLAHKWGLEGNLPGDHPYKSSPP